MAKKNTYKHNMSNKIKIFLTKIMWFYKDL